MSCPEAHGSETAHPGSSFSPWAPSAGASCVVAELCLREGRRASYGCSPRAARRSRPEAAPDTSTISVDHDLIALEAQR